MSATIENIRTEQGVTYNKTFTWSNSFGVDPADYTADMQFRVRKSATSATIDITDTPNTYGSKITLGGTASEMTIAISIVDDDMNGLDEINYVYDILLTDTSGNVRKPFAGEVENSLVVTR